MTRIALALLLGAAALVARAQDDDWKPPPPRLIDDRPPVRADAEKKADGGAKQGAEADQPTPPYVGLLIGLGLGLAVFAVYKFVVEPKRKRRFLVAALELIARDDRAQLPDADRMLADALTQGLSRRDVVTARFHLAYVRAQLGRFAEAAAVLADVPAGDRGREVVYLDLYLQSKLNAHDRVEALYRDNAPLLDDLHDTKLIVGITYLERARTFWAAKQMGGAVDYFNKLRKLGVLLDEIPEHIDDHQVVLGVAALFEKNPEQAEKHFRGAVDAAAAAGKPSIPGRLGLLLCTWTRDDTPDVEEGLASVSEELSRATPTEGALATTNCAHQGCRHEFRVSVRLAGQRVTCTACRRGFRLPTELKPAPAATGNDAAPDRLFGDNELLLTNVLLWRAVSLLYRWRALPPNSGLPPEEQTEFVARLERVRAADPDLPDPDLLEGLVRYYFAAPDDDEARRAAVALIERAIENGVNVPEVIDLANRERRVAEHLKHGLERFFAHVYTYIGDGSVPEEYRADMRARLNRSARFKPPPEAAPPDAADAPSLSELQARSQVLRDRVYRVHKQLIDTDPNGTDAREISSLVGDLEKNTQELLDTASKVQRVEHDLMASTSEFLLKEEEQQ